MVSKGLGIAIAFGVVLILAFGIIAHEVYRPPTPPPPEPPVVREPVVGFTDEQCGFCHRGEYAAIIGPLGGGHNLGCAACHPGHPPALDHTLSCEECHGVFHGDQDPLLLNCTLCHSDPHAILSLNMEAITDEACVAVGCHYYVAAAVYRHPSKHDEVACSACHPEHELGATLACGTCHAVIRGHYPGLTDAECLRCHPHGHDEVPVVYVPPIPNEWCAPCHVEEAGILVASGTKHAGLACAYCHPEHKSILSCEACHGTPHSPWIHQTFPECALCHETAHSTRI